MYAHRIAKAWSKLADFYSMSETLHAIIHNFEVVFFFKLTRNKDNQKRQQ